MIMQDAPDSEKTDENRYAWHMPNDPFDLLESVRPAAGTTNLVCIDNTIKELNHGQKQFNRLRRIGNSKAYRGFVSLKDRVRKVLGKEPTVGNIYEIFRRQQATVRRLNDHLQRSIDSYQRLLPRFQQANDEMFEATAAEAHRKADLETNLKASFQRYQQRKEVFDSTSKHDIDDYFSSLHSTLAAQRSAMAAACELKICADTHEYFESQNEVMVPFERLITAQIFHARIMSNRTRLYQDTLDRFLEAWQTTDDLAKTIAYLGTGVAHLASYNQEINQHFTRSIQTIVSVAQHNQGLDLLGPQAQYLASQISAASGSFDKPGYKR
jgi:hypothetical protein